MLILEATGQRPAIAFARRALPYPGRLATPQLVARVPLTADLDGPLRLSQLQCGYGKLGGDQNERYGLPQTWTAIYQPW